MFLNNMDDSRDNKRGDRDDSEARDSKIHKETTESRSMQSSSSSNIEGEGMPSRALSAVEHPHGIYRQPVIGATEESQPGSSNAPQKIFPQKMFPKNLFPRQHVLPTQTSRYLGPEYQETVDVGVAGYPGLQDSRQHESNVLYPCIVHGLPGKAAIENVASPSKALQGSWQHQSPSSCVSPARSPHAFPGYFDECADGDQFLNLSAVQLGEMIGKDDLLVSSENVVFEAVNRWIRHDETARKKFARHLWEKVRFNVMSHDYLCEKVQKHPLLRSARSVTRVTETKTHKRHKSGQDREAQSARKSRGVLYVFAAGNIEAHNKNAIKPRIQRYDFDRNAWSEIKGIVPSAHSGVVLYQGRIWFIGGIKGQTQEEMDAHAEVYSCVPHESEITWEKEKDLNQERCDHGVVVFQGEMYVVGGRTGTKSGHEALDSVEVYRKGAWGWEWTTVEQMNAARWNHGVAAMELKLYAYGGGKDLYDVITTAECYSKVGREWLWHYVKDIPNRRCPFYVTVMDGLMYAVGGDDSSTVKGIVPDQETWPVVTHLPEKARGGGCVAVVYNSQLYVLSVELLQIMGEPGLFRFDPYEVTWLQMNRPQAMGYGVRGVIYNTSACISSAAPDCTARMEEITKAAGVVASEFESAANRPTVAIQGACRNDSSYQSAAIISGQTTPLSVNPSFCGLDFGNVTQTSLPSNQPKQTWRYQAVIHHDVLSNPLQTSTLSMYGDHQPSRGESSRSCQSSGNLVANQPQNIIYQHSQVPYRANQSVAIHQYQQPTVPHPSFQQSSPSKPVETRVVASPRMINLVSSARNPNPAGAMGPAVHSPAESRRRNDGSFSSRSGDNDPVLDKFIDDL